jgi:hypothetical protein
MIAERMSATYSGTLPDTFPFDRTSLGWADSVRNVLHNHVNGNEVLFFDCIRKSRRGDSWRRRDAVRVQSVMALRGPAAHYSPARFDLSLFTERVDGWTMLYRGGELLSSAEIETHLANM